MREQTYSRHLQFIVMHPISHIRIFASHKITIVEDVNGQGRIGWQPQFCLLHKVQHLLIHMLQRLVGKGGFLAVHIEVGRRQGDIGWVVFLEFLLQIVSATTEKEWIVFQKGFHSATSHPFVKTKEIVSFEQEQLGPRGERQGHDAFQKEIFVVNELMGPTEIQAVLVSGRARMQ